MVNDLIQAVLEDTYMMEDKKLAFMSENKIKPFLAADGTRYKKMLSLNERTGSLNIQNMCLECENETLQYHGRNTEIDKKGHDLLSAWP
ncbi:predicted protein [Sclerotinia sclerotiorum 1980 UF-70]|uniref:Uncharacterized protein n=1 Tax=Sclerotinia sclerotiorum (strain ATCC 18683 / 1980 / Ss-1) TaxID=665079 RepID=A7E7M9_SCLS1|nr:predicted protein [Sclerotinia sclerotiorum 1980 UF-70]EDN96381.1 predicted protein [Sclerotinia sclerotiorum 1980 UF-70]